MMLQRDGGRLVSLMKSVEPMKSRPLISVVEAARR